MHKFVMRTCFFPSIRLFTKMLQIREFGTSQICRCCMIRDFVLTNRNVSTGNADTSNAAYTSQKEQNYLWLPFFFLLLWIFYVFVLSCVCYVLCASVYMCFVVTCWERADLLALVCGVFCEFVTFPLVSWVRCGT